MDILGGLREAIDIFYYNIIMSLAALHWSLLRGLVMMGYTIRLVNDWLIDNAFVPLIAQTNASLSGAVGIAFMIALLVLGITYLLAAFIRLEVVNFRSALTWYVAGMLFFALGPSLYRGMNEFRTNIAQGFYLSALNGLQNTMGGTFSSLDQVQTTDLDLGPLCDYLDVYLPNATGAGAIDGLDVALAYLRADGPDVMGYPYPMHSPGCPAHLRHPFTTDYVSPVPQEWHFEGSYFDVNTSSYYFGEMDDDERADSLAMASSAHARMLTAWPLVLFGVVEQMVYLLITIAMGITFLSFGMAILFAFFKKTEVIAKSIIDQWIELIVQTVVIAMMQSLVVTFFLGGTASGNGMVVLGIGLICLIFMLIVLWSGVKAVWNSMNRLFTAMGQATGGAVITPGSAGATALGAGMGAVGTAVSMGSGALAGMSALQSGATRAQAAGIAFGGSQTLSEAARTMAYLPGVRNTSLGEAAEQFTEGAITRQVARKIPVVGRATGPMVGSLLLTDRNPDNAETNEDGQLLARPMIVPAVGEGLDRWTLPRGARGRRNPLDPEFIEGEEGEMFPVMGRQRALRTGTFTPIPAQNEHERELAAERRQERSDHARSMQGEEMEQHLSDALRSSTGIASPLGAMVENDKSGDGDRLSQAASRLENSADALARAGQTMTGQLKVSGTNDVASVMGDVVGQAQADNNQHMDYLQVGQQMARAVGVTPQNAPPVQRDLARFGMFLDRALKMGLSPQQTEQVVREVKASPEGKLTPETREQLDKQVQNTQGVSWVRARNEVDRLEHHAGMIPHEMTAQGAVNIPPIEVNVNVNNEGDA